MWAASRIKGSDKDARLRGLAKVKGMWEGPWSVADFYQLLSHVLSASPLAAFSDKLPDNKGCHGFTSNQDKVVCKAFLVQKKAEGHGERKSLSVTQVLSCMSWGVGMYRMTASDLFIFMKQKKRGKKGTQHGWDGRIQRFM